MGLFMAIFVVVQHKHSAIATYCVQPHCNDVSIFAMLFIKTAKTALSRTEHMFRSLKLSVK